MFLEDVVLHTQFSKKNYVSCWAWSAHWFTWYNSKLWLKLLIGFVESNIRVSPFPTFFCPSPFQPQKIFSELYIHLEDLVLLLFQEIREDSSFQTEFSPSCRSDTLPKSRSLVPLNSEWSTFEEDSSPRCSFSQLPTLDVCHRFITLDDAGCCWLLVAAACWKQRHQWNSHLPLSGEVNCPASITTTVGMSSMSVVKLFVLERSFWAHNLQWDSAQPFGQTMNHFVDRRRLCLIPSPA